jgi:hypothetical protein
MIRLMRKITFRLEPVKAAEYEEMMRDHYLRDWSSMIRVALKRLKESYEPRPIMASDTRTARPTRDRLSDKRTVAAAKKPAKVKKAAKKARVA